MPSQRFFRSGFTSARGVGVLHQHNGSIEEGEILLFGASRVAPRQRLAIPNSFELSGAGAFRLHLVTDLEMAYIKHLSTVALAFLLWFWVMNHNITPAFGCCALTTTKYQCNQRSLAIFLVARGFYPGPQPLTEVAPARKPSCEPKQLCRIDERRYGTTQNTPTHQLRSNNCFSFLY